MENSTKEAWVGGKNISEEGMRKRRKINKKIFKFGCLPIVIIIFIVIITGIFSDSSGPGNVSGADSLEMEIAYAEKIMIDSIRLEEIENSKKTIDQLKSKFYYNYDEFKEVGFYKHKRWPKDHWPTYTTLTAGCNSNGYLWVQSNFHGNDWIMHTNLIISNGESKVFSESIETYNKNHRTEVSNDASIYENVTFADSPQLLLSLNNNLDRSIKIRLQGSQYHHDYTLNKKDHQALSETYQFATAIKFLRDNGIDYLSN